MSSTVFVNGVTLTDAEWFQDVNNPIYDQVANVKNSAYGALANGSDDAAAIQSALNAGIAAVYIPSGTYTIGTALSIPSGVTLYGDGLTSIIKKKAGSAIGCIVNKDANGSGTGTQDSNIVVRDIKILGENTATTLYGVRMENVTNFQIRNVWTQDILNGDSAAIDIDGCQRFLVAGCHVNNTTNNGIKVRCQAEASSDFVICDNVVDTTASQDGIFVANSASFSATRFTIFGNTVKDAGDVGIEVGNTGAAQHTDFTVSGNSVYSPGSTGVLVREAKNWAISGNSVFGGGTAASDGGIGVVASAVDTTDGSITGNTVVATDAGSGIHLGFASTFRTRRISITGNSIASANRSGIELNGGDEFTIQGNTIKTSGRMGIELVGTIEAVNRAVITGNTSIGATFDGINADVATNCVITNNNFSANGRYGIRFSAGALNNVIDDNITQSNVTAAYNGTTQNITAAGTAVVVVCSVIKLTADNNYTLSAAPTVATGFDGQVITIINVDTVDTITLQDQGTLPSSNLRLSATTVALGPRDSIQLMYSDDVADWVQIGQVNVV